MGGGAPRTPSWAPGTARQVKHHGSVFFEYMSYNKKQTFKILFCKVTKGFFFGGGEGKLVQLRCVPKAFLSLGIVYFRTSPGPATEYHRPKTSILLRQITSRESCIYYLVKIFALQTKEKSERSSSTECMTEFDILNSFLGNRTKMREKAQAKETYFEYHFIVLLNSFPL